MRIVCQKTILMKYALFFFLKKRQNMKFSSAANYRWRFKGLKPDTDHCRDAGGSFGKMEAAHEEQYFRKLVCFT